MARKRCKHLVLDMGVLIVTVLMASCEDTASQEGGKGLNKTTISFQLGGHTDSRTRSARPSQTAVAPQHCIDITLGDALPTLALTETVTSMDDAPVFPDEASATRGIPVYSENFENVYHGFLARTFGVNGGSDQQYLAADALLGSDKEPAVFTLQDGYYQHDYGTQYRWPSNHLMYFFFNSPRKEVNLVGMQSSGKADPVSYLKYYRNGNIVFDYTSPAQAVDQEDILFASRTLKMETMETDNEILFFHPLTGVKFRLGTLSDENLTINVTSITLKGLLYEGSCTLTPVNKENGKGADNSEYDSKQRVHWSFTDEQKSKTNDFTLQPPASTVNRQSNTEEKEGDVDFPYSFYGDENGELGTLGMNNLNSQNYAQTFWFIPQSCSKKQIDIVYSVTFADGTEKVDQTANVTLPEDGNGKTYEWKAGELHTYTIGFHQTHATIESAGSTTDASGLTLTPKNTGNTKTYLRVALVANWVNDEQEVFGQYDMTNNAAISSSWKHCSDGFYYYCTPVNPENPAPALLTNFKASDVTIPIAGTHLELSTIVQAVQTDDAGDLTNVTDYWGSVAQNFISTNKN